MVDAAVDVMGALPFRVVQGPGGAPARVCYERDVRVGFGPSARVERMPFFFPVDDLHRCGPEICKLLQMYRDLEKQRAGYLKTIEGLKDKVKALERENESLRHPAPGRKAVRE